VMSIAADDMSPPSYFVRSPLAIATKPSFVGVIVRLGRSGIEKESRDCAAPGVE
jgi:hypothetical protein